MPALHPRSVIALLFACGSALLGGALALLSRTRRPLLERTRTFAFAAAGSVVAFHLLPEVLPELGAPALFWIAGGFALPWLLEALAHALAPKAAQGRSELRVAAEVGFAALVFHSLIEGLTLWAALKAPGEHLDLEIAIVAHHAPLTAAVTLPFLELKGPRAAALRVAGIALAGAAGVLAGAALPGLASLPAEKLLLPATAATAGALLHIAFDEIGEQRFSSRAERAADLLACIAGVAVATLGAFHQPAEPHAALAMQAFVRALSTLALYAAPALLASAVAAEVLCRWRPTGLFLRFISALPVDAALLTLLCFGVKGLLIRAAAAGAFAVAAPEGEPAVPAGAIDESCRRGPWLLFGLLLAAAVHALAAPWALASPALSIAAAGIVLAAAALIPQRAGAAAATLVTAVLALKGAPAPLVFTALTVGSAVDRASLRQPRGALALVILAPAVTAACALLGLGLELPASVRLPLGGAGSILARAHPAAAVALAAWLSLVLVAVFQRGVRGYLSPLRHGPGHAHD